MEVFLFWKLLEQSRLHRFLWTSGRVTTEELQIHKDSDPFQENQPLFFITDTLSQMFTVFNVSEGLLWDSSRLLSLTELRSICSFQTFVPSAFMSQ